MATTNADRGVIRRRSTNIVEIEHLRRRSQNDYPIDAVVSLTLKTMDNVVVTGADNLPMAYVQQTTPPFNVYRGTLLHTLALPDSQYQAIMTVTYQGAVREFNKICDVING